MSEVDANIPLQVNTQGFDVGKMLSLADMAQQMRARQTQMQNQNALSQVLSNPQSYDPNGDISQNALRAVTAANPQIGMQMKEDTIQEKLRRAQEHHYQTESGKQTFDFMSGIAGVAYDAYTESKKTGASEQDAIASATKARNAAVDASGGMLSDQQGSGIKSSVWEPVQGKAFASMNKEWVVGARAQEAVSQDAARNKIAQQRADTADRQAQTTARREEDISRNISSEIKSRERGAKAPAGFEWDPSQPDQLRTIKGGPKDPDSKKPWSGREKVYTERILGSANQAATAIQNLSELPVGASTGLLGTQMGSHSGGSLLSASFGALKNKMTSQEVQDNNVMLAGVKRNLAAIETMGLAPAGALTESMGSLELREGDSHITKLRKFAEMRQIVEKGMDVPLADPAIPPEIKALATKVVDTVMQAVPYTQADVTKLQRDGDKNPDMTFSELMKSKGLGAKSASDAINAPKVGTVEDGHRFKGGDPSKPESWEKI